MMKKLTVAVLALAASAQTGLCDWHHYHEHGSSGTPDPVTDAFVWTAVLIMASSVAILFLAGPVLVIRTRRIRDFFWVVPLANAALYLLSISLRPYPGGFAARFQPPGRTNTIVEVVLVVLSSLVAALVLALVQWLVRTVRRFTTKPGPDTEPETARGSVPAAQDL